VGFTTTFKGSMRWKIWFAEESCSRHLALCSKNLFYQLKSVLMRGCSTRYCSVEQRLCTVWVKNKKLSYCWETVRRESWNGRGN